MPDDENGFGSASVASAGGKARAASMTPEERSACARKAVDTQWGNITSDAAPPVPPVRYVMTVDTGTASIEWPSELSAEDCESIQAWIEGMKRKVGRSVAPALSADTRLGTDMGEIGNIYALIKAFQDGAVELYLINGPPRPRWVRVIDVRSSWILLEGPDGRVTYNGGTFRFRKLA